MQWYLNMYFFLYCIHFVTKFNVCRQVEFIIYCACWRKVWKVYICELCAFLNIDNDVFYTVLILLMVCRYDYGLIVIKCMEVWEGVPRYDGKTMPELSSVNLSFH